MDRRWPAVIALAVAVVILAGALFGRSACRPPAIPQQAPAPNVILVVIDTLRADHLGAWGYERPTSPRLDLLAEQGVTMSRFFANASWTRQDMAAKVTGRYAREVGVYEERYDRLPADVTTLAERLQQAGWVTLGVTSNPNLNALFGFDQGFDGWVDSDVVFKFMPETGDKRSFHSRRNPLLEADEVTGQALAQVDAHADRLRTAPLHLQVVYIDPHYPYSPPAEHLQAVGGGDDRVSRYDGEIRQADAAVGALLDGLRDRGLMGDTLVIVTSDHGEGLGDHPGVPKAALHGYHLYDSNLHVPFLAVHPELPAGRRVDTLASSIDLLPTVLDFVGLEVPAGVRGRSLVPLWRGEGGLDRPERVFAETDFRYVDKVAVRTPEHKLVRNLDSAAFQEDGAHEQERLLPAGRGLLRKLPPVGTYRMGAGPEYPGSPADVDLPEGARAELDAALDAWLHRIPRRPPEGRDPRDAFVLGDGTVVPAVDDDETAELDPAVAEQLRALGYLGGEQ